MRSYITGADYSFTVRCKGSIAQCDGSIAQYIA